MAITKNGSTVYPVMLDALPQPQQTWVRDEMALAQQRGWPVAYIGAMAGVPGGYMLYAADSPQWHTKVADIYPSGHVDRYGQPR